MREEKEAYSERLPKPVYEHLVLTDGSLKRSSWGSSRVSVNWR